MAIKLKGQSVAVIEKMTVLAIGGGLHVTPDEQIPAGNLIEAQISSPGPFKVYWSKYEEGDTHKILVLEQGDVRNALLVPADADLTGNTANVSLTQLTQESYEGLDADLPIATLQAADIEPVEPPKTPSKEFEPVLKALLKG